jgi:hypothetical protein
MTPMGFYTVDRYRTLSAGMVLTLTRHTDIDPPELQDHVDRLFPDGVSQHGDFYFLNSNQRGVVASPNLELLWEYVRRSQFPDRPSRYQATFGCATLAEALSFRATYGTSADPIWEVDADVSFRADMALLTQNQTVLVMSLLAELYWSGQTHPNLTPIWEYLLVPPVTVIRQV